MEKLNLKHITLMDETETEEAKEIFKEHQRKYSALVVVPLTVSVVTLIMAFAPLPISQSILLNVALGAFSLTFIGAAIYSFLMKPYWKLLRIAKLNDRVRHEEHIREKERQRLADPASADKKYTVKDIEKTLPDEDEE